MRRGVNERERKEEERKSIKDSKRERREREKGVIERGETK